MRSETVIPNLAGLDLDKRTLRRIKRNRCSVVSMGCWLDSKWLAEQLKTKSVW